MENIDKKSKDSSMSIDNNMKSPLFKIVLVGDSDVGKSSIINTFLVKIRIKLKKN